MNSKFRRLFAAIASLLLLCAGPTASAGAAPASCGTSSRYQLPVAGPVVDGFRLANGPFGPGNRGLEFGTEQGSPVRAIGDGEVIFAGLVVGSLFVTIRHPDGLRSSYSYLTEISAVVGQRVRRGDLIGLSGQRLHLGVRRGTVYLDPALLFARRTARLVPDSHFGRAPVASVALRCVGAG